MEKFPGSIGTNERTSKQNLLDAGTGFQTHTLAMSLLWHLLLQNPIMTFIAINSIYVLYYRGEWEVVV